MADLNDLIDRIGSRLDLIARLIGASVFFAKRLLCPSTRDGSPINRGVDPDR